MHRRLLILCWHNVEGTPGFPSDPGAGTSGMIAQFRFLRRLGHVVDLSQAVERLIAGQPLLRRSVAITFDDGYLDNLEVAAPILRRLGLPATFFLAPELLDGVIPWWEELAWSLQHSTQQSATWGGHRWDLDDDGRVKARDSWCTELKIFDESGLRREVENIVDILQPVGLRPPTPIMGWEGARALRSQGFTIGSHGMRHSILANETPAAQGASLLEARRRLEDGLGDRIDLLAYPNGRSNDFNGDTIDASQAAGYRAAVTTIPGLNGPRTPPMELRRFVVDAAAGVRELENVGRHYARTVRSRLRNDHRAQPRRFTRGS